MLQSLSDLIFVTRGNRIDTPAAVCVVELVTVVRPAVLNQYNDCRYRKSIRDYIPMYIFSAVCFLHFLQAVFLSDFTSRSPNKDQQVKQLFY